MLSFTLRRLLQAVPILLGVSILVFLMVQMIPGSPLDLMLPPEASPELIEEMKITYGFDKPVWQQYLLWLWQLMQGDLGYSIFNGAPVAVELFDALGNTFVLAIPAAIVGFGLGTLFGVLAALSQGGPADKFFSILSITGVSLPHYWFAIVLVVIFSVQLNWLPAQGMSFENVPTDWEGLRSIVLAGDYAVANPDGRCCPSSASCGVGGDEPGVRQHAVRKGPVEPRCDDPHPQECGPGSTSGNGASIRLSSRRLYPC